MAAKYLKKDSMGFNPKCSWEQATTPPHLCWPVHVSIWGDEGIHCFNCGANVETIPLAMLHFQIEGGPMIMTNDRGLAIGLKYY